MSTSFNPQPDGLSERMNASMEQYVWACLNHQQDDWVRWIPLYEFAANNGTSEWSKCTAFFAVQGTNPQMSWPGEPMKVHDYEGFDADQVQATIQC